MATQDEPAPGAARALLDLRSAGQRADTSLAVLRGVTRMLHHHGLTALAELPLSSGRRADVVALSATGDIWIVEIKSGLEDLRADRKWPEYRAFCDRLYFAVTPGFPSEALPGDTGLILADAFGGEIVREAPVHRLQPARRKAVTLAFARAAASRLLVLLDPGPARPA